MTKLLAGIQGQRARVRSDRGVSAIEYGLILALFALAVVAGSSLLFQGMRASYVGASNDVGTPRQPTQAPSNTAVPDPTRDPDETPPPHVPVVAPNLTRTVICSSTAVDVNVRTSLEGAVEVTTPPAPPAWGPIASATVLVASHPDADVVDSSRTIRYTPDTSAACNSTVTIPYTFSYRDAGVFYTDGTGNLVVTVLKPAIAEPQTRNVACSPTDFATFDLSAVLSGWPSAQVSSTRVTNGSGTAETVAPTTVTYDPATPADCSGTRTIEYTFTYVVNGVTYSDGRGQLQVVVGAPAPVVADTLQRTVACAAVRVDFDLDQGVSANPPGIREAGWSNINVTGTPLVGGQPSPGVLTVSNNDEEIRYQVSTPADCGTTKTITYTFTYVEGGQTKTGTGTILLSISAPVVADTLQRPVPCVTARVDFDLDQGVSANPPGIREAGWSNINVTGTPLVGGQPSPGVLTVSNNDEEIRYQVSRPADCGTTKTITYTFTYVEGGQTKTGTGTILLSINRP